MNVALTWLLVLIKKEKGSAFCMVGDAMPTVGFQFGFEASRSNFVFHAKF